MDGGSLDATIRLAEPEDAFALAALTMQDDRECGAAIEPGFLTAYADAWLADRHRVSFLAVAPDGRPVGMVTAALVTKLPSSRRPVSSWMHVSLLFVTADARGSGIGTALMQHLLEWGRMHAVDRVQLNAAATARGLYRRIGFTEPDAGLMELRLAQPHGAGQGEGGR
ncbi:MAG: GNAT family N-acetyltransferase [Phycicoccus sp.]|nr:GNAT family N-acetyltransferase [Phycicoccus sp.]